MRIGHSGATVFRRLPLLRVCHIWWLVYLILVVRSDFPAIPAYHFSVGDSFSGPEVEGCIMKARSWRPDRLCTQWDLDWSNSVQGNLKEAATKHSEMVSLGYFPTWWSNSKEKKEFGSAMEWSICLSMWCIRSKSFIAFNQLWKIQRRLTPSIHKNS